MDYIWISYVYNMGQVLFWSRKNKAICYSCNRLLELMYFRFLIEINLAIC